MEERIAKFIAALSASGVRVSIAESQDAWRAIEYLGIKDRDAFRLSLRATLVKDAVRRAIVRGNRAKGATMDKVWGCSACKLASVLLELQWIISSVPASNPATKAARRGLSTSAAPLAAG